MSVKDVRISRNFEVPYIEWISHIMIMAILLVASIFCGIHTMPERLEWKEKEEVVQRAGSIVLQNERDLKIVMSEPISSPKVKANEWKPEVITTPKATLKPEKKDLSQTVIKREDTDEVKEEVIEITTELPTTPEVVIPSFFYTGSLRNDYCVGSTIDISSLEIYLNEEKISLENCTVTGNDTSVPGEYYMMITYEEFSVKVPYLVVDYKVTLHGTGMETTSSLVDYKLDENILSTPVRLGKEFTGWYKDEACTVPFVSAFPGEVALDLYAGWKEFDSFACDDAGYITAYTGAYGSITDGLLNLASHPSCVGVRASAFIGCEEFVTDIYVPANITDIEAGAFDSMPFVFYIYVHPNNPVYTSVDGVLYTKDMGTVVAYPSGR